MSLCIFFFFVIDIFVICCFLFFDSVLDIKELKIVKNSIEVVLIIKKI